MPAADLERALRFYRAVFALSDTPLFDEPPARIALLLPSAKTVRVPGLSLVQSPDHTPGPSGAVEEQARSSPAPAASGGGALISTEAPAESEHQC